MALSRRDLIGGAFAAAVTAAAVVTPLASGPARADITTTEAVPAIIGTHEQVAEQLEQLGNDYIHVRIDDTAVQPFLHPVSTGSDNQQAILPNAVLNYGDGNILILNFIDESDPFSRAQRDFIDDRLQEAAAISDVPIVLLDVAVNTSDEGSQMFLEASDHWLYNQNIPSDPGQFYLPFAQGYASNAQGSPIHVEDFSLIARGQDRASVQRGMADIIGAIANTVGLANGQQQVLVTGQDGTVVAPAVELNTPHATE